MSGERHAAGHNARPGRLVSDAPRHRFRGDCRCGRVRDAHQPESRLDPGRSGSRHHRPTVADRWRGACRGRDPGRRRYAPTHRIAPPRPGDNTLLPGNPIALALNGGRSFGGGKVGQPIAIDVIIDLSAVPATELLGSYDARFTWNTAVLRYDSTQAGSFGLPAVIPDTAAGGILRFNATDALGKAGSLTLARLWFTAAGPGPSNHQVTFTTLSA